MDPDRLNSPKTSEMPLEVLGHELQFTQMLQMWNKHFDVKTLPKSKMDETYQHPSTKVFMIESKPSADCVENSGQETPGKVDDVETGGEERAARDIVQKKNGLILLEKNLRNIISQSPRMRRFESGKPEDMAP